MAKEFRKKDLYELVASNLNQKGIKPFSARQFSPHSIQSFISRKLKDPVIEKEINKVRNQLIKQNNG